MIYLLQDCYKDNKGEYHDILKIGYSKDSFSRNRQGQYNTHNFGYKFLGEREGSCELENYLHKLLKEYNLDREWFRYSQEVIDKFWKVKEEDISDFSSQDELNEYIRYYILKRFVPSVNKLKELYLDQILSEIKEKDAEYEEYKETYKKNIIEVFKFVSTGEYEYFSNLKFDSQENIEILKKCNLTLSQIVVSKQRNKKNFFKNNIMIYYKIIKSKNINGKSFEQNQSSKKENSEAILDLFKRCETDLERTVLLQKIISSIKVSQYEQDFISISKKTGEPVYNSFIEIANERSWEVAQVDYLDKISVIGFIVNEEFTYEESSLKNKISDNLKFPDLKNSLISHFKIKSKYTLKDIKFILNDIYKDLGITKTPKASELENYFDLKLILVQDSLSGKRSKGYLILGIK